MAELKNREQISGCNECNYLGVNEDDKNIKDIRIKITYGIKTAIKMN